MAFALAVLVALSWQLRAMYRQAQLTLRPGTSLYARICRRLLYDTHLVVSLQDFEHGSNKRTFSFASLSWVSSSLIRYAGVSGLVPCVSIAIPPPRHGRTGDSSPASRVAVTMSVRWSGLESLITALGRFVAQFAALYLFDGGQFKGGGSPAVCA